MVNTPIMLKLIIFDLDGTLLDTSRDIHKVLNQSLAHFNLPQVTLTETMAMVGNGARKLVEAAIPPERAAVTDDVYHYYSKIFVENDNALTALYPDEDVVLRKLLSYGVQFAIVTNKPQAATQKVVSQHLSPYYINMVIGGGSGYPLKPDPASTLSVLDALNVKRQEALFVGDGETDVKTANAAGIAGLSVLWGYRSKAQLAGAGATMFAENYTQFLQILQEKFL